MGWRILFVVGIGCLLIAGIWPDLFSFHSSVDDQIFSDEVSGKQAAPIVRPAIKTSKIKKVRPRRLRKDSAQNEKKNLDVQSEYALPDEVKEEVAKIAREWQETNNVALPSRAPEGEFDNELVQALNEPQNAPPIMEDSRAQWEDDSASFLSEELGMEEETFAEYEKIKQNLYGGQREYLRQRGRNVNPAAMNEVTEDEAKILSTMREEADGDLKELFGEEKYNKYQDYIDEYLETLPESERERALLQFVL